MQKPNKQSEPKKDPVAPYQPTPREAKALEDIHARNNARAPAPKVKVEQKDGVSIISNHHADLVTGGYLLQGAIGGDSFNFLDGLLEQLCNASSKGKIPDERALNFMVNLVKGVKPRDQVEAMLASQMAATHNATMTFARRLAHVETIEQQDSAERAYNKLARTFAMQVEALKRYRSQGEQVVRVERVTVHEGGQAIVGNVSHGMGGRGAPAKVEQSP
jgi:hypothetical protein